jgi:hypothetical protein
MKLLAFLVGAVVGFFVGGMILGAIIDIVPKGPEGASFELGAALFVGVGISTLIGGCVGIHIGSSTMMKKRNLAMGENPKAYHRDDSSTLRFITPESASPHRPSHP